jgi:hypothetical protein
LFLVTRFSALHSIVIRALFINRTEPIPCLALQWFVKV